MDRRLIQHFDLPLLGVTLALMVAGLLTLYGATRTPDGGGIPPLVVRQAAFMALGLGLVLVLTLVDYRVWINAAYPVYGGFLALLLVVLVFGQIGGGSQRWIELGFVRLQPSEFGKVALVLMLARFLHERGRPGGLTLPDLVQAGLLVLPAFAMIFLQPDLGTSLLFLILAGTVVLFAGLQRWLLITAIVLAVLVGPVAGFVAYRFVLDDYQRDRVVTFLHPEDDPHGKGYQTIQSRYAIGSGRFWGKGFGQGTQAQLRFLPEQHTDFIFSVYAEERGFVGSVVLLLLYLGWLALGLNVARRAKERFGTILAFGLVAVLAWQVGINLGGVLGFMPVTGVTLPLMSYGGSSVLTVSIAVGLLLNISMRRFMF